MKSIQAVAVCCLCATLSAQTPALEPQHQRFPIQAIRGEDLSAALPLLYNRGSSEIVVSSIESSCDCSTGFPRDVVFKPGEGKEVYFKFRSDAPSGPQNRKYILRFNNSRSPQEVAVNFDLLDPFSVISEKTSAQNGIAIYELKLHINSRRPISLVKADYPLAQTISATLPAPDTIEIVLKMKSASTPSVSKPSAGPAVKLPSLISIWTDSDNEFLKSFEIPLRRPHEGAEPAVRAARTPPEPKSRAIDR
jgi:hypothetical protein